MRVSVGFQDERFAFEVPDGRLVADWQGPTGSASAEVARLVAEVLENPLEYPPLRLAVVPGDRVVIALGAEVPEAPEVLRAVCRVLKSAGPESLTVLVPAEFPQNLPLSLPTEVSLVRHDPEDRSQIAYLATTSRERRVYLNRLVADADFVLPIGCLTYDSVMGYNGPWGALFPALSDSEARHAAQSSAYDLSEPDDMRPLLKESVEVSWLLGSQFQVGLVGGVSGVVEAVAGLGSAVLERGAWSLNDAWTIRADSRAELVIVGVGRPGVLAQLSDVAKALATATRLVRRGGKVVVLSRAEGELGPSARRLIAADDPRSGPSVLRGHESDGDYAVARRLAQAVAWADVYLLSSLAADDVEGLAMVPLDRPEDARRLAAQSGSTLVVSHADLARAEVADEAD